MREQPRGAAGWIVRRLPPEIRDRCFTPAYHDLAGDWLAAGVGSRSLLRIARFRVQVLVIACQAAAIALGERRHRPTRPADSRRWRSDQMLLQDLRFAVRMLRKNPGFTLVGGAVITLGIGANAAMFSLVHAVLLRPLPYAEPAAVVRVHESSHGGLQAVSPPNYLDWKAQTRTLSVMGAFQDGSITFGGGTPERLNAGFVAADVFPALGIAPFLGRTFTASDGRPGGARVVIIGHRMWRSRFNRDPSIIGRPVRFEGRDHEVVGVMPAGFTFPGDIEVWFPLILTNDDTNDGQRGAHYLDVVARLAPGATVAQAQEELTGIEAAIARRYGQVAGYGVWIEPLLDNMVGSVKRPLAVFLGAVAFVLLIACMNVSNLLLSRGVSRRPEVALRAAIGATRWQIVRQFLVESLLLSSLGGAAGVLLAAWIVRVLPAVLPADLPRADGVSIDVRDLVFSLAMTIAAGLLFGIAPALHGSTADAASCLKESGRDGAGAGRRSIRRVLIAFEIAVALILLAGAGVTLRSFERLIRVDPGFNPDGVLSFRIALPEVRYPNRAAAAEFFRDYLDRLASHPNVAAAGAVMAPPLGASAFGGTFTIIGQMDGADQRMQVRPSTPRYFETLRIPLLRGRTFTTADREGAANVAVISDRAARRFWPNEDPIGKRIRIHPSLGVREREREIVGIVGDVKIRALEAPSTPVVYVPHAQYVTGEMTVFVRTTGDPMSLLPSVAAELMQLDRDIAMSGVRSASALVERAAAQPRFRMRVLVLFAATALALAALGLYGVMVHSVTQRQRELGLRLALGAESRDLLRLILGDGLKPVAIGIAVGLPAAALLTRLLSSLLFETRPFDPLTFVVAPAFLTIVAATACYLPARRAARADPSTALRS